MANLTDDIGAGPMPLDRGSRRGRGRGRSRGRGRGKGLETDEMMEQMADQHPFSNRRGRRARSGRGGKKFEDSDVVNEGGGPKYDSYGFTAIDAELPKK